MAEKLNSSLNSIQKKSKQLDKEVPITHQLYKTQDTIVGNVNGSHFTAPVDFGIKEPSEGVKKSLQKAQLVQAGDGSGSTPFGRVKFEEKDLAAVKHVENVNLAIEFYTYVIDYFFKTGDEALIAHGLKLFPNIKTMVSRAIKKQHELQHKVKMLDVFKIQNVSDAVLAYKIANREITRADLGLTGQHRDVNVLFPSSNALTTTLDPSDRRRKRMEDLTVFGRDQFPYGNITTAKFNSGGDTDEPQFYDQAGINTVPWNPLAKRAGDVQDIRAINTFRNFQRQETASYNTNRQSSFGAYVKNMIRRLYN